jgi:hypothetical protein
MRAALSLFIAALLAACAPEAPAPTEAPAAETSTPTTDNTALLSATPQTGAWSFQADEGLFAAGFGAPESEYQLVITCTQASGALHVMSAHELAPDQATTLNLIFDDSTRALPAQSFNEGLPSVSADLEGEAASTLVAALSAPRDVFGVDVAGETHVYPWSAEIARALEGCR